MVAQRHYVIRSWGREGFRCIDGANRTGSYSPPGVIRQGIPGEVRSTLKPVPSSLPDTRQRLRIKPLSRVLFCHSVIALSLTAQKQKLLSFPHFQTRPPPSLHLSCSRHSQTTHTHKHTHTHTHTNTHTIWWFFLQRGDDIRTSYAAVGPKWVKKPFHLVVLGPVIK